ncbi:MBG domain-containing protein [Chitinophaga sp. Cy-1792]|uniref:MBG domain-containing protein n=1 Tax=Chitinophaga sp. Cy-1792 TaxID=2608339 RepID=UPI0014206114
MISFLTGTGSIFCSSFTTCSNLIIIANSQSKIYGGSDPALTYTTNGLISGDQLSGILTRDAGENAGQYSIKSG